MAPAGPLQIQTPSISQCTSSKSLLSQGGAEITNGLSRLWCCSGDKINRLASSSGTVKNDALEAGYEICTEDAADGLVVRYAQRWRLWGDPHGRVVLQHVKHKASGLRCFCVTIPKSEVPVKEVNRHLQKLLRISATPHHGWVQLLEVLVGSQRYIHLIYEICLGGPVLTGLSPGAQYYSEDEVVIIANDLLKAVGEAHKLDVAHGSLCLDNVLLNRRHDVAAGVKVWGFGLGGFLIRTPSVRDPLEGTVDSNLVQCAAPEVLQSTALKKKSSTRGEFSMLSGNDTWAIGVILFFLACGYPPFWGRNMRENITRGTVSYGDVWPSLSVSLRDFIQRLLEMKSLKRMTVHQAWHHMWLHDGMHKKQRKNERLKLSKTLSIHEEMRLNLSKSAMDVRKFATWLARSLQSSITEDDATKNDIENFLLDVLKDVEDPITVHKVAECLSTSQVQVLCRPARLAVGLVAASFRDCLLVGGREAIVDYDYTDLDEFISWVSCDFVALDLSTQYGGIFRCARRVNARPGVIL
eukprot:gnl/MRDRNA2_/MRDRNA2_86190_c0_seq1.p1 gnl/MRDRNA2_/MRDRNA2_86190_c0~~gnl/MRDRNA2_/MRDRNA2_86190_c0_seq1.p1  ORF type:complete len:524 (-),score=80.79 gnl/MRDRNA2_/MRDRNA2_86190_c0_seq1:210-1781(-)